jgi:membrane protease YdiL (CAAX protease family)
VALFLKSIGIGLLVIIAMAGPWAFLAAVNLRAMPSFPWSALVMAGYLWSAWLYTGGTGPPGSTRQVRSTLLRARKLNLREWRNSLLAGIPAIAALWLLYAAVSVYSPPPVRAAVPALPIQSLVAAIFMSALVAAVSEEAGCRGYMQVPLEKRFGPAVAITTSTIAFTVLHLSHGASILRLVPFYAAAGVVYGLMAYASDSILPSFALHFVGDALLFSLRAFHVALRRSQTTSSQNNAYAILVLAGALALALASVLAFKRALPKSGRSGAGSSHEPEPVE